MWCTKCKKHVLTTSQYIRRGEDKGNYPEQEEPLKEKLVSVHNCAECGKELENPTYPLNPR